MTTQSDDLLAPDLVSWVEAANDPATDFPIQNLPFGMFRDGAADPRPGIAIGDRIVDLVEVDATGWAFGPPLSEAIARSVSEGGLNALLARGSTTLASIRRIASLLLRDDDDMGARAKEMRDQLLVPMSEVEMLVPARIGDYTDFYASIDHASNVGSMFRPDNALLPNYKWVPIGYHGRASSIVASGTDVRRPHGQTRDDAGAPPVFGPSRRLDYELEVGAFIGAGNAMGEAIPVSEAEAHVAGLCLVNDWSARDVQTWEYQPLGPFLAKSFCTTVSPWIVTLDALAPFRAPAFARAPGDPAPLPYLHDDTNQSRGGIDITLEVSITSRRMREERAAPFRISRGSFTSMYWTIAQLVAHHASNGCNLRPGDLLASGTVSGPDKEMRGCLLERTWRGTEPLTLPTGETRRFLEDGDEVVMRGWCERDGVRRIGFGECRGVVVGA